MLCMLLPLFPLIGSNPLFTLCSWRRYVMTLIILFETIALLTSSVWLEPTLNSVYVKTSLLCFSAPFHHPRWYIIVQITQKPLPKPITPWRLGMTLPKNPNLRSDRNPSTLSAFRMPSPPMVTQPSKPLVPKKDKENKGNAVKAMSFVLL